MSFPQHGAVTTYNAITNAWHLVTPALPGTWLISVWAHVVTPASGGHPGPSSTLGPVTLTFTHDGIPLTIIMSLFDETGKGATSNSGNTTNAILCGSTYIASDAAPINFTLDYASHGTIPMLAHIHIKAVFVGEVA